MPCGVISAKAVFGDLAPTRPKYQSCISASPPIAVQRYHQPEPDQLRHQPDRQDKLRIPFAADHDPLLDAHVEQPAPSSRGITLFIRAPGTHFRMPGVKSRLPDQRNVSAALNRPELHHRRHRRSPRAKRYDRRLVAIDRRVRVDRPKHFDCIEIAARPLSPSRHRRPRRPAPLARSGSGCVRQPPALVEHKRCPRCRESAAPRAASGTRQSSTRRRTRPRRD